MVYLLGECVHGVREYWLYKKAFIEGRLRAGRPAVGFEVDPLPEAAPAQLIPLFHRVFQCAEVLDLLEFCRAEGLPVFGFDSRRQVDPGIARLSDPYFDERDRLMAKIVGERYAAEPGRDIVCLTHNLHIRRNGSQETNPDIRLKSVREHLDDRGIPSRSVSLHARRARYWDIRCQPAAFDLSSTAFDADSHGFLFGSLRESTPLAESYDESVFFEEVGPPTPLDGSESATR